MTNATLYNLERGLTLQSEAARHPALQHQQENKQQEETNKKTVAIPKEASRPNKGNILKSSPTSSRISIPINQNSNSYYPIVKPCIHKIYILVIPMVAFQERPCILIRNTVYSDHYLSLMETPFVFCCRALCSFLWRVWVLKKTKGSLH